MAPGILNTMLLRVWQYLRYWENEVNFSSTAITIDRLFVSPTCVYVSCYMPTNFTHVWHFLHVYVFLPCFSCLPCTAPPWSHKQRGVLYQMHIIIIIINARDNHHRNKINWLHRGLLLVSWFINFSLTYMLTIFVWRDTIWLSCADDQSLRPHDGCRHV